MGTDNTSTRMTNKQDITPNYPRATLWTIACTSLCTLFFWLAVYSHIEGPNFSSLNSLVNKYVLNTNPQITEPYALYMIGQLVKDGTIVSLKDFWAFESSFYQSLITILIALIGVLGVAAYLVVKHSSEDTARKIARDTMRDEINREIRSQDFHERVSNNIRDQLGPIGMDFENKFESIENLAEKLDFQSQTITSLREQLDELIQENKKLSDAQGHIAERLATLDKEEEAGTDLNLTKELEEA